MFTAYSVHYTHRQPTATLVGRGECWAHLLPDILHYWGVQVDPEPVQVFNGSSHYGFIQFGPLDVDGRNVYGFFQNPDGTVRHEKYFLSLEEIEEHFPSPMSNILYSNASP